MNCNSNNGSSKVNFRRDGIRLYRQHFSYLFSQNKK